jgi:hypothetical protein
MRLLRFAYFPEMGGVFAMKISTDIHDDAPSDGDRYDRVHGRYRQDYQDYRQSQDPEALELMSANDWWMLLLPNPWMEVHRL